MSPDQFAQLTANFETAERAYPDLLEPWSILMGDATVTADQIEIMRNGLRATFRARFPQKATVTR